MHSPRIHSTLTKWRPIPVRRALARAVEPVLVLVDERHRLPWMAVVTGLLGLGVLAELILAMVVTA